MTCLLISNLSMSARSWFVPGTSGIPLCPGLGKISPDFWAETPLLLMLLCIAGQNAALSLEVNETRIVPLPVPETTVSERGRPVPTMLLFGDSGTETATPGNSSSGSYFIKGLSAGD